MSIDFIKGLPTSSRYSVILVVVDRLSKYAYFIITVHPYTTIQVTQVFAQHVFKLHGLPESIIINRIIFAQHVFKLLLQADGDKNCSQFKRLSCIYLLPTTHRQAAKLNSLVKL